MYTCLCRAVTDRTVRSCVRAGHRSVEAVTRACGAGGACGSCHADIRAIVREERAAEAAAQEMAAK